MDHGEHKIGTLYVENKPPCYTIKMYANTSKLFV